MPYIEFFNLWIHLHKGMWKCYEANPKNKALLIEAAEHYTPCLTAFDRAFVDSKNQLVRSDGKTPADDAREAAERQVARDAELEKRVVLTADDFTYAASLSPAQLAQAYQVSPDFARKYRKLVRDFGFKPVPVFAKQGA